METRQKLLMGAMALLYFGPLLAGLGGFGWRVMPLFVLVFLVWLVIMRPQDWLMRRGDWRNAEAMVALAARLVVQVLLVAVLFGIGRGIGGVFGVLPPFALMLPLGISFLAVPLARLIWDPWQPAVVETGGAEAEAEAAPPSLGFVLAQPLADLAEPDDDKLREHLAALSTQLAPSELQAALLAHADHSPTARHALEMLEARQVAPEPVVRPRDTLDLPAGPKG